MTDPNEPTKVERELVEAIIAAYNTTRTGKDFVPHILARPAVRQGFARFERDYFASAKVEQRDTASVEVGAVRIETVSDIDVPTGAWDWIEKIAATKQGPHLRLETPKDAETLVLWHDEKVAAFVLNVRTQHNNSVQYRVALASAPAGDGGERVEICPSCEGSGVGVVSAVCWTCDGQGSPTPPAAKVDAADGGAVKQPVLTEWITELARRDIMRTQTDFIGRMHDAMGSFEFVCDEHGDGEWPEAARDHAGESLAALAGLALAQLAMVSNPTDPIAALTEGREP